MFIQENSLASDGWRVYLKTTPRLAEWLGGVLMLDYCEFGIGQIKACNPAKL